MQGELVDAAGGRWIFKIWDLGEGCVCVFTQTSIDNLDGSSVQLTIFDRFERIDHRMEARLAWQAQEGITYFLGLAFETPIESGLFYDRYLALRGIRAHDDRTIRGRALSERELEALTVVQRPFVPGQPGQPLRPGARTDEERGGTSRE